jgi:GNAT superfamily N-acetyltransferase
VRPLAALLRDASGAAIGGIWCRTVYSWLVIEMLFVPEALRCHGVGAALVRGAEAAARARGCIGAQVDTFDLRARRFYERLGFAVIGTVQDLPPGHSLFHLGRKFDLPPHDVVSA